MKIGKMFRWYWQNTYWGLVGFYGAMLFLMLLGFVIMVFSSTEEVSVNGFAFSAEIMLLVMGIIFFPAGTRFGLSNGVSRKTVFCGMVLFLLALSVGMTLVNLLGQWAGSAMGLNTDAVEKMVYPSLTGLGGHFGVIVSQIAGGWALGMLGYFIGGAYYRIHYCTGPAGFWIAATAGCRACRCSGNSGKLVFLCNRMGGAFPL